MVFGRSPIVNNLISWGAYLVAVILMICNICFSMTYFLSGAPNPSALQWWGSLTASLFMSGYEAIMLGVLTTPVAWFYLIKVPTFIERFPNPEGKKVIRFLSVVFLILSVILLAVVYYMDWSTTFGGLGATDAVVASFLATCLVIGSEVLFIGGNICAWLAFLGTKQEEEAREEIEGKKVYETTHYNGSAHAPTNNSKSTSSKSKEA